VKYSSVYTEKITRRVSKLKKKDKILYRTIHNKIDEILDNPNKRYKFLRNKLKGFNRLHIGSFVLVFKINHKEKTIYFEDFEHHDKIYE